MGMTQQFRFWFNYNILACCIMLMQALKLLLPRCQPSLRNHQRKKNNTFSFRRVFTADERITHTTAIHGWWSTFVRSSISNGSFIKCFRYHQFTLNKSNSFFFFFFAFSQKSCDCENILNTIIECSQSWIAKIKLVWVWWHGAIRWAALILIIGKR